MKGGRGALIGLVAAAAGAGVAAGVAAERRVVRAPRQSEDPFADEPFGRLPGRTGTVIADDGVPLHVEEAGPADAPLTLVLVHGYALSMHCWHFQRRDLDDLGRILLYDQRSHGRSGRSDNERCTIDQLGDDLRRVLEELVPTGPVALVGHSMGGMTIMALADRHPTLFRDRVVAVGLLSTSAGRLAEVTFGLPAFAGTMLKRVRPQLTTGFNRAAPVIGRRPLYGSDLSFAMVRRFAFGSTATPALVRFLEQMLAATPVEVVAAFAPTFLDHDKLEALDVLKGIPTLVLVGDRDMLTPPDHARAIADALPEAEFVEISDAGHMALMEKGPLVNAHLRALLQRAGA